MKDLQVKYTDPLDLIPYENNPRINDYAVKKVMESIKEYGFTNPIIVDADMVIIAGHTRREAKHEDFMDAMLRGLFGGSVGHIEITGKRNGKTDEEIAEIVDKTIKDIISGMAGVELEEIKEGNGYTEVHITGNNVNPLEVREYIERELKDRLAMVL